jgi:asparagine synthase (glutamine-hydrolysing)
MCGVAGILRGGQSIAELQDAAERMAGVLNHRGPDDSGVWLDEAACLALSHRRLSVIDLSPTGQQPMVSRSGRTVIVYNGEVYNFRQLRADLAARGVHFRGGSDTEVVLEACERWGVKTAAQRLVGMFAFALWDVEHRELKLVRDRLGIKPIYWASFGESVAFASELRGLRQHPQWEGRIDRNALTLYLRRNCIPAPYTIFEGVHKLEPGCVLTVDNRGDPRIDSFWSLEKVAYEALSQRLDDISDVEGLKLVNEQLQQAVNDRLIADVPLGAFLSGGIDSSTVVALMQAQSDYPVRTFSLGFPDRDHDEAPDARRVAAHLRTDHTEFYVSAAEAQAVIPELPDIFDEPFGDSSQVPTYLVSRLARKYVTVAMSGDGGDEVFAGYNRHRLAHSPVGRLFDLPAPLRRGLRRGLSAVSTDTWSWLVDHGPRRFRGRRMADNIHKLAGVLEARDWGELHELLASHWQNPAAVVVGGREPPSPFTDPSPASFLTDPLDRMLFLDTITYLPDDILTKVDRASMSVSLEARVPLLDHRLLELMWRLPTRFRVRGGDTKWALRQILYRHVPPALLDRPKHGFGIPIGAWLRGPLRDWAEQLLDSTRLAQEGYFDPKPIRQLWDEHLAGRGAWQFHLWDVLMFQAWLERSASVQWNSCDHRG